MLNYYYTLAVYCEGPGTFISHVTVCCHVTVCLCTNGGIGGRHLASVTRCNTVKAQESLFPK